MFVDNYIEGGKGEKLKETKAVKEGCSGVTKHDQFASGFPLIFQ